jgi:hypothetical protein
VEAVLRPICGRRDTPARRHIVQRFLTIVILLGVVMCVSGCAPGKDFRITNATDKTLTVVSRFDFPGQQPAPTPDVFDTRLILSPREKQGVQIDLSRGVCKNLTFLADDSAGLLIDQDPTPICEDTKGHGNTWTIIAK